MVVAELTGGTLLRQVVDPGDAEEWRAPFIGAYQTVFSGFPYNERWNPDEAEAIWRKLTGTPHNVTLLATRGGSVLGFGIAIPLAAKRDVARELGGLIPINHTFYLAELGVLPEHRNQEIGRTLVVERLRRVDPDRWTHVCLRVSSAHTPSMEMYKAMGFAEMGVAMDVSMMRNDGRVITDRRRILSKVLSQVSLGK